jgi:acetylglutamate synthase
MEVHLTDDQKALSLWEERERRRAEILAAVDQVEASLAQDAGRTITRRKEAAQLADEIKRRDRPRLENTR